MISKIKTVPHEQIEKIFKILYYFLVAIIIGSVFEFGWYWGGGVYLLLLLAYCFGKNRKKFMIFLLPGMGAVLGAGIYLDKILEAFFWAIGILVMAVFMKRAVTYADAFASEASYFVKSCRVMFPLLLMLLVEGMQQNAGRTLSHLFLPVDASDANSVVSHLVAWTTVAFIWVLWWVFFAVLKKAQIAVLIVSGALFLLGFVNLLVLHFTTQPLLPTDIFIFKTAMNVMGTQTFTWKLGIRVAGAIAAFLVFMWVYWRIYRTVIWKKKEQAVNGLITVFLVIFLNFIFHLEYLNFQGHLNYGFLFYFFSQIYAQELTEPEGYDEKEALPETGADEKDKTALAERPNVIIVMNEAFSDLTLLGDFKMSEDPIPYFHSLQKVYPNGISYASVYGNNTISSEFECLTGISTGLTTKAANLYARYLPENMYSLSDYFSELDYKTVFFHPGIANSYNRENVYRSMGFDETIFRDDLPEETDTLRGYVTDRADYQKIVELIEDTKEPLFLMNTTIQNHGDYGQDLVLSPEIRLKDIEGQRDTELYLSLLRQSDEALKMLLESVTEAEEPTVVLFFGDHQPIVGDEFYQAVFGKEESGLSLEEQAKKYQVPYLVWANYGLPDAEVPKVTSHNYLSLVLLDACGFPSTEWLALLRALREEYPVFTELFTEKRDGTFAATAELKEKLKSAWQEEQALSLLKQYEKACYGFVTKRRK